MSTRSARNNDQAFVLHSINYRNSSLIVDMFTREFGRLSMVAKGARQDKSGLYSVLQPFIPLYVGWGGKGEMSTLYTAETQGSYRPLLRDAIYSGFYLNELLVRLLHKHDSHPLLFDSYKQCLNDIQLYGVSDANLRYFEIELLEQLGYGINLELDTESGDPVCEDAVYNYIIEYGPRLGHDADSLCIKGKTLIQMQQRNLNDPVTRKEAKLLLRTILEHYLGHKPLKTRELVQPRSKQNASTMAGD